MLSGQFMLIFALRPNLAKMNIYLTMYSREIIMHQLIMSNKFMKYFNPTRIRIKHAWLLRNIALQEKQ